MSEWQESLLALFPSVSGVLTMARGNVGEIWAAVASWSAQKTFEVKAGIPSVNPQARWWPPASSFNSCPS